MTSSVEWGGTYTCGDISFNFSGSIPTVVSLIVTIIKIVVPILLVIFGSIDFLKAVIAQKEDEIKKGQQTFIKRLIAAVLVFFVVQIVQLIVSFAAKNSDDDSISKCFNCFISKSGCKAVSTVDSGTTGV